MLITLVTDPSSAIGPYLIRRANMRDISYQQVQSLFLLMTRGSELMMDRNFITMDGKMKKVQEMEQQE
eukprot:11292092-Ditylum_brightwellii.AAC.1